MNEKKEKIKDLSLEEIITLPDWGPSDKEIAENKAYQYKFSDGFTANKFLKKPKHKAKDFVYTAIDPETILIRGGVFLPIWDGTDHLHFVCIKCKTVADILAVRLVPNYGSGINYALFFCLGCPRCGSTGQRKTYLDMRDDSAKFQETFSAGKLFFYGDKREPELILDVKVSQNEVDESKED